MAKTKSVAPYVWGVLILAVAALFSMAGWEYLVLLALTVFAFHLVRMADADNIFHMSFLCGHFAFLLFPLLLHGLYAQNFIGVYSSILSSVGVLLAIALSNRSPAYVGAGSVSFGLGAYFAIFLAYMAVLIATTGASYMFTVPFLSVAFHLLTLSTRRTSDVGWAYFMGVIAVGVYYTQFSTGYGRLTMAAPLFVMTMMLLSRLQLPFRKPLLLGGVVFGAASGTMVRSDTPFTFDAIATTSLTSSTSSPLVQLDEIVSTYHSGLAVQVDQWLGQVALFFLGVLPRELWPSKPEGFGFLYTVENLDTSLVKVGHSIAALYPGEHVYYLGPVWGVLGTMFAVGMLCALWRIFCRVWGGYLAAGVVVFIPSFYWGGMQAYSIRTLMWMIPAIALAVTFLRMDGSLRFGRQRVALVTSNTVAVR